MSTNATNTSPEALRMQLEIGIGNLVIDLTHLVASAVAVALIEASPALKASLVYDPGASSATLPSDVERERVRLSKVACDAAIDSMTGILVDALTKLQSYREAVKAGKVPPVILPPDRPQ